MYKRQASARADELQGEVATANETLATVRAEQKRQSQLHADEIVHLKDAFERLRTGALRTMRKEVGLLEEGLHAARLTPPKLHVMVDHAERAIGGLQQEVKRLETES